MNSTNLRVQKVDYAASWLLSSWVVSSLLVIALFCVWWSGSLKPAPESIIEEFGGLGGDAQVVSGNVEPPGNEEAEALIDPSLGDSLATLTDVASSVSANTEILKVSPTILETARSDMDVQMSIRSEI